jgi:hypothetical protein
LLFKTSLTHLLVMQLELTDLPGQTTSLTPQLSFVPHATEKAVLKVARAKLWANDKYMQKRRAPRR